MQGGDINALATNENLIEKPDGTLGVKILETKGGKVSCDGRWLHLQIKRHQNHCMSEGQTLFLAPLEIDWNRNYPVNRGAWAGEIEENPNCIILKEHHEAGGDINQLTQRQSLRKSEDGTWESLPATKGDLKPGQWLDNQRTERKRATLSDTCIRALEAIEIDWRDKAKKHSHKNSEENPNYMILKEYHEAGGDINQLTQRQSLRKSEDGTWESLPATKGDLKPGKWLADQRAERKRATLSDVRIRALEAIETDWRDGAQRE